MVLLGRSLWKRTRTQRETDQCWVSKNKHLLKSRNTCSFSDVISVGRVPSYSGFLLLLLNFKIAAVCNLVLNFNGFWDNPLRAIFLQQRDGGKSLSVQAWLVAVSCVPGVAWVWEQFS